MIKRYHGNTKIFFPNPYVLRVSYPRDMTESQVEAKHGELRRRTHRLIKGTWGHSPISTETVQVKNDHGHSAPPGPGHYAGMAPGMVIVSLFDPDYSLEKRGYFCFKDEIDALQFKLSLDSNAIHVHMWPSELQFIIHEVVEDES